MSALIVCLWIYAGVCAGAWLVSELTREYSWVDRIWSIAPVGYVAVFAGAAGFHDPRPEYARYQATTSAVVPWRPKRRPEAQTS